MSARTSGNWHEWNQRRLTAECARVREALERHARRSREEPPAAAEPAPAAAPEETPSGFQCALDVVCAGFRLSPFERDVLLLCAGMELDARFATACSDAQGDSKRPYPSFGLALAVLDAPHWSALTPHAPLRRWRLLEVESGEALTTAPLRVDERILHFLAGIGYLDDRLSALAQPLPPPDELSASHAAIADRIVTIWSRGPTAGEWPVIQLCGRDPVAKRALAAAAAARVQAPLYAMRAAELPTGAEEREALARLWEREAILGGSILLIEVDDGSPGEEARGLLPFVERLRETLVLAVRDPVATTRRASVRLDVEKPTPEEQRRLWEQALGASADRLNGQLRQVVAQFSLPVRGIRAASVHLREGDGEPCPGERLWEACRLQARTGMDDLATRIEPAAGWDDLVLPAAQLETLRAVVTHVRQRTRVYEDWGFARRSARGLGISALFSGPSGTGKTMAAEVLANELRLDLYHIDLSSVVSKYIGETEKNLRRLFDAAEDGGAILLFDEADALFGKRGEVKDSHDRYANLEVSYLLQRMEAYRGLAILTTNFQEALDTAFLRRIRFLVQFPFPDATQRAEIWRRVFPSATPTGGIDPLELSRLTVAGGNIRNIALNAAFLAADAGLPVGMPHLLRAVRSEFAKLERPVPEMEIQGWR